MKQYVYKFMLVLLALLLLSLPLNGFAQGNSTIDEAKRLTKGGNFIVGSYKVTKPIIAVGDYRDKSSNRADPTKHKATLEIVNFGTLGNTVLLTLDSGADGIFTASWSGKDVNVLPGYDDSGTGILVVLRNGSTICGSLMSRDNKWIAMLNSEKNAYTITDFKRGMTRSEVENIVSKLGLSQFKFTKKSGNLNVYSLLWLDQKKRYNFFGTDYKYELTNDKNYGDFYFDSNGKLVKWFLYF